MEESAAFFDPIASRVPDHRLARSVRDYLAKAPTRLAAERAHATAPEYDRLATRAEVMDATVCSIFYHTLYLGEVHRLATMVCATAVADAIHGRPRPWPPRSSERVDRKCCRSVRSSPCRRAPGAG